MSEPPGPWSRTAVPPTVPAAPAPPQRSGPERAVNAPWPVVAFCALIVAAFLWQISVGRDQAVARFALVPIELSAGRVRGLFGHIFLHGGWLHLFFNTTALLAFGAPVARVFGSSPAGALRFAAYFLLCGVLGGLFFWALHPYGGVPLVGASGAISGLMGGAARLIERRGAVGSPFSRAALGFLLPWVALNLIIAAAGLAVPLPIAWEAHLGGLAAGVLLLRLFAPRA
ncbi:MAG: rhomboid family intramembrane serine protease [Proteobacteria bacterium]|nr:rhomboid family intramembrane serine protease [Pseudomonadota bacterium]